MRGIGFVRDLQGRFSEIGTLGLKSYMGFVEAAHTADLRWPACYPLFNRIRRSDPEVGIIRSGYTALARKIEIEVVSPDEPADDDLRAAEFYQSELENVEGGITRWLEALVSYTPFMGWSWWEVVPGMRSRDWTPPDDDPWRSEADDNLIGVRRLAWRDHSTFESWDLDDATGRLKGLKQNDFPNPAVVIPLENSLHVTFGDATSPEGLTPLEAVYRLERIKYGLEVVQGIGFEHAAGYLNVIISGKPDGEDKAMIERAARSILTAQEGNYALWNEKATGEIKDTNFSAAQAILAAITYYGLLKLQLYHMQWAAIASTAGTGAYSAMSDASSMFLTFWNAMIAGFVDQYDQQVGRRLWEWNRDKFPGATKRPRYRAKAMSKIIDLAELGTFLSAINNIVPFGDDDLIAIRKRTGFLPETLPEPEPEPEPEQDPEDGDQEDDGDPDPAKGDGSEDDANDQIDDVANGDVDGKSEMESRFEDRRAVWALWQELHALREAVGNA